MIEASYEMEQKTSNIGGLKVGGPYRVRLSDGSEYTAQTVEDLFLTLGTSSTVNLTAQAAGSIEEIVVTASQISSMIKTGASSLYGSDDLANMPSIGRDVKSTIQQDPSIWIDPANSNTNDNVIIVNKSNSIDESVTDWKNIFISNVQFISVVLVISDDITMSKFSAA